jgi:uncharacterized protein
MLRKHHSMPHCFSTSGCTAIITGASSGLGAEFARQLASEAECLILVARRENVLEEVARETKAAHANLHVVLCPADLATEVGRRALWSCVDTHKLSPSLLINNAGLGDYGDMVSAPVDRLQAVIDLNITALTMLAHEFASRARGTAERPAGIINVGSLAAVLPLPDLAVYAASKAYVLSLSEALSVELAEKRIAVCCVCPGPTPTNFGANARRPGGKDTDRGGQALLIVPPASVVADALSAIRRGKSCIFPSARVSLASILFRLMPRQLMRLFLRLRYARARGA